MTCGKVVEAFYGVAFAKKMVAKGWSNESGTPRDKYVYILFLFCFIFFITNRRVIYIFLKLRLFFPMVLP